MRKTLLLTCLVMAMGLTGCDEERDLQTSQEARGPDVGKGHRFQPSDVWLDGDVAEITGVIWRSQLGNVVPRSQVYGRYFIKSETGTRAYLKSADIDKLTEGSKLWVKGTVECVRYKDLPNEHCYINVSQFAEQENALASIIASFKRNASTGFRVDEGAYLVKRLKPGMSRSDVRKMFGEPDAKHSGKNDWFYTTFYGRSISVQFEGEKVVTVRGG